MMALVLANEAYESSAATRGGVRAKPRVVHRESRFDSSALVPANVSRLILVGLPHRKDHGRSSARFALHCEAVDTDDILATTTAWRRRSICVRPARSISFA